MVIAYVDGWSCTVFGLVLVQKNILVQESVTKLPGSVISDPFPVHEHVGPKES